MTVVATTYRLRIHRHCSDNRLMQEIKDHYSITQGTHGYSIAMACDPAGNDDHTMFRCLTIALDAEYDTPGRRDSIRTICGHAEDKEG